MLKKLGLAVMLSFLCPISFADICPSIKEIKDHTLKNWTVYDSYEDKPLAEANMTDFIKRAHQFVLAEWTNTDHKSGAIHCYYYDKDGSDLGVYLGKNDFVPMNAKNFWYQVSGAMHCAASSDKCEFRPLVTAKGQLAKK